MLTRSDNPSNPAVAITEVSTGFKHVLKMKKKRAAKQQSNVKQSNISPLGHTHLLFANLTDVCCSSTLHTKLDQNTESNMCSKKCSPVIEPALAAAFNQCIQERIFPKKNQK